MEKLGVRFTWRWCPASIAFWYAPARLRMMHCTGLIYEFISILELERLSGVSPYVNKSQVALLIINKRLFSRSKQTKNKTKTKTTNQNQSCPKKTKPKSKP